MSWKESYTYSTKFTALAPGTGVAFTDNEIRIDTDADFEFIKTMYFPGFARARVRYRDDTNGRFLMKATEDIRTIGGRSIAGLQDGSVIQGVDRSPNSFIPFIWARPYIISGATSFTVSAADFANLAAYDFYLSFHGSKIRPGKAPWDKEWGAVVPYTYPIDVSGLISVSANSTFSAGIPTDADSHFLVYKITGSRTGQALVTIKDSARDRQWMDSPVHIDNMVGCGMFPNILPSPRFIERRSVIAVTVQDFSGATNSIEMNFHGVKLYEKG